MTISKKTMKWIPWLLILPVVLIRGFTTVYPILMTVKNSFFNNRNTACRINVQKKLSDIAAILELNVAAYKQLFEFIML